MLVTPSRILSSAAVEVTLLPPKEKVLLAESVVNAPLLGVFEPIVPGRVQSTDASPSASIACLTRRGEKIFPSVTVPASASA